MLLMQRGSIVVVAALTCLTRVSAVLRRAWPPAGDRICWRAPYRLAQDAQTSATAEAWVRMREAEISREPSERTTGEIRAACVGTWTGECAMTLRNWLSGQRCTDNCVLYGACPQPNAVVFAHGMVTRLSYNTVHVDSPNASPKRPAVHGLYDFTLSRLVFSSTVVRATSISTPPRPRHPISIFPSPTCACKEMAGECRAMRLPAEK